MERVVGALKAMGEPTRLRILMLLARGELTVSELVQVLGQSQPRVSRHLKLMTEAGVVQRMPEGAWVFYALGAERDGLRGLIDATVAEVPVSDLTLARDLERLEAVKASRAEAASDYFRSVAQDWDRIRALHLAENEVETAMRDAVGDGPFGLMVDIGTGTGRVIELFADAASRAVGIDISHDMLTVARANLERAGLSHCSARRADLYALPFDTGAADLVTIHQVLHYLDEPSVAVREAARVLAPGGCLLIVDFDRHDHEFLREEHAHRRLGFGDSEVAEWTRSAGLELRPARTLEAASADGLTVKIWLGRHSPDARNERDAA